jgi:serine/threonine protein kinase
MVVGSHPGCDLKINHASISQRHALFACQPDGVWWVYDLRSRYGTNVNGEPAEARALADGEEVRLGELSWRVGFRAAEPVQARGGDTLRRTPFGDFVLLQKLHHGRGGRLYRALWTRRANREVALRRFPTSFQSDESGLRRLMERLPQASKVRHKNVVRLFHAGFYKDTQGQRRWYLAMEYLPGGSLRDRLAARTEPLPVADVVRFATDIASALDAAGAQALVHRNINPSCVLFAADGKAKLGDFFFMRPELADSYQEITRGVETPADVAYQSPERLRSSKQLTPASDLYSLAACMYEALTLRPPFEARDIGLVELVTKISAERPPAVRYLNPSGPQPLNDLIMAALAKSADERPPGPKAFQTALSAVGVS